MKSIHFAEAPHHMVLTAPWTYQVVGLTLRCESQLEETLEISLRKGSELVQLLFIGVADLQIDPGFPWLGSGMQILDTSAQGMEEARVRVSSFEQDPSIHFWARSVERVVS